MSSVVSYRFQQKCVNPLGESFCVGMKISFLLKPTVDWSLISKWHCAVFSISISLVPVTKLHQWSGVFVRIRFLCQPRAEGASFPTPQLLPLFSPPENPWCRFLPTLREAHPWPTIYQRHFPIMQGACLRMDTAIYFSKELLEKPCPHPPPPGSDQLPLFQSLWRLKRMGKSVCPQATTLG